MSFRRVIESRMPAPSAGVSRAIERQVDLRSRALEAVEVLAERERPPLVEADDLEDAVAAVDAIVANRDDRLGRGSDLPVDADDLVRRHRREAIQAADSTRG